MSRRSLFFPLISIAALAVAGALLAAVVTVKRGVVEKISTDGKTITVKFAHSDASTELSVAPEIDVLLEGKHAELTAIKPGMSATVQIDGNVAERIIAHTVKEGEVKTPKATKPTKPKSTAKATTTRKSKTPRKSKPSSKNNEPNELDDLPVATTPLAGLQNAPGGKRNGPSALDSLPVAVTPLAGAKSPSSGNNSGPSALDSLPVATTPLAGSSSP